MPYIVSGDTADNRAVTETHTIPASHTAIAILASGPPKLEFPSGRFQVESLGQRPTVSSEAHGH